MKWLRSILDLSYTPRNIAPPMLIHNTRGTIPENNLKPNLLSLHMTVKISQVLKQHTWN